MQQLQPAAGWRRPQQHLGLSPDGAAGSDEGQQKRGEPGQPLQQPGRGGGGRAAANREDAAAARERALSLCQWQRGTQAGDQQLISGSAVQPDESAKNAQDHGVATERHWGAAQPAAASAVPGAAGVLQQVKACDQQADHRHVEPAEDPGGGLEGAQHPAAPGAAGGAGHSVACQQQGRQIPSRARSCMQSSATGLQLGLRHQRSLRRSRGSSYADQMHLSSQIGPRVCQTPPSVVVHQRGGSSRIISLVHGRLQVCMSMHPRGSSRRMAYLTRT